MKTAANSGQPDSASAPVGAPRFLFVLGAPRSGTSWIQKSLSEQEGWVTVPELHYAVEVLKPVLKAWNRKAAKLERSLEDLQHGGRQRERLIGMPVSVEFEELARALRLPLESLVERARATYGPIDVFLEKTPSNSVLVSQLSQVFPDGYMLHVIRDPRSMVRSLRSAGLGWGADWAPRSVLVCALMWRTFVAAARRGSTVAPHYLEVKYEDARVDLGAEISKVRTWLGIGEPTDSAVVGNGVNRHEILSARVATVLGSMALGEPEGFGDGSTVRAELTRAQRWLVEVVTAQLMEEYGYVVKSGSAKRLNHLIERLARPIVTRLSENRRVDFILNLHLVRPTSWVQSQLRK